MTEREALLRAVCEHPDDDTPRLVFADYLEEDGDPDRAEFIRLQVRFAAMLRAAVPGTEAVRRQERAIWARRKEAFRMELPEIGGVTWFEEFHRGFVERATVGSDAQLVRHADVIFNRVPVQHLVVRRFDAADGFATLPHLRRLRTLHLFHPQAGEAVVRRLMACDQLNESVLVFAHFEIMGRALRSELERAFGGRVRVTE